RPRRANIQSPPAMPLLPSFFSLRLPPPSSSLFPYTTLFRSTPCSNLTSPKASCVCSCTSVRATCSLAFPSTSRSTPCCFAWSRRSEEHTSELQSRENLVCRLLLEKKKNDRIKGLMEESRHFH